MSDWDDPVQRAAVWYLAAFAGLASVLLAGVQLSDFHWDANPAPWWAALTAAVAVGAALTIVSMATRVLLPKYTITDLVALETAARKKLTRADLTAAPLEPTDKVWAAVTRNDKVLQSLAVDDGFRAESDAPIKLSTLANDGDSTAQGRLRELVAAANRRQTRIAFRQLRQITLPGTAILLACVLIWPAVSTASDRNPASPTDPVTVTVTLLSSQQPATIIGPGCSQRVLTGVAIEGQLDQQPLVAIPEQADCPAAILRVSPTVGSVAAAG
jgi:hypothetical protein